MLNNEPKLLKEVLHFFNDDSNQTRRVLLMYSLTRILVSYEEFDSRWQQVTIATGILLMLPLSSCKTLLICCDYAPSYRSNILELLSLAKHGKPNEHSIARQLLTEAAALTGFIEDNSPVEKGTELLKSFKTEAGTSLLKGRISR